MSRTLHVLDGTAMLFRLYHAGLRLRCPRGREVGAVDGLCAALARFVRDHHPSYVVVVFDPGRPTFRHTLYESYKANRPKSPDDLSPQFDLGIACSVALGFRTFRVPGYEADDLMATLATRARRAGLRTHLQTPDKDVLQLVDDSWVRVTDPRTQEVMDAERVRSRFGVAPPQLTDYLALTGDSSDNVPGVTGVGPKAAVSLIDEFGDLEGIYANLDRVEELPVRGAARLAERLASAETDAFLSRDLVRLRADVPLGESPLTLGQLRYRGPQPDAEAFFRSEGIAAPVRALRSHTGGDAAFASEDPGWLDAPPPLS